jgi:hypothetical protein
LCVCSSSKHAFHQHIHSSPPLYWSSCVEALAM